jgi:hypothetical protein
MDNSENKTATSGDSPFTINEDSVHLIAALAFTIASTPLSQDNRGDGIRGRCIAVRVASG